MNANLFQRRQQALVDAHDKHIRKTNEEEALSNGIYSRWQNPVITRESVPLDWRYDFSQADNPFLMERLGVNATFNAGAIYWHGKHVIIVRIEGNDRKSFFAVAESENGVDNFKFWDAPVTLPQLENPDTNAYDMRLVEHEDGYVYGLFCTERKDQSQPSNLAAAVAECGIVRTQDLKVWERLPDLVTHSGQQRNVVLHPEFIEGKYAFYTRPQDGFISVGSGGGVGWGLSSKIDGAEIFDEQVVDHRYYHTIKETKNGLGPAPIKTEEGWLHLAHGVRNTAAGLRYVLYMFMTDLDAPWKITHAPGGHFIAPLGDERLGDVSNVVFSNGWICKDDGQVLIYYASSDTRLHVATTSKAQLIDYVKNTPNDPFFSHLSVQQRLDLISKNASQFTHGG